MLSLKRNVSSLSEQQREDLREAVKEDDRPLVYEILGIDSLEKRELIDAAIEDDWKNLRSLLNFPSEQDINAAIVDEDIDSIIRWLDSGEISVDYYLPHFNQTVLMVAALYGKRDIVDLLIERGADVDRQNYGSSATPLSTAMSSRHIEIVHTLLDEGATSGRASAFLTAARYGNNEIVNRLMGAVDLGAKHGALRNAARHGHHSTVLILIPAIIDAGGDLDHTWNTGDKTALQLAHREGHDDIADALRADGAKRPACYGFFDFVFPSCY